MGRQKSETSLRAKLMTLDVEDIIYLPDTWVGSAKPTLMERAVRTLTSRDKDLKQRRFITERWIGTRPHPPSAGQMLKVRRVFIPD